MAKATVTEKVTTTKTYHLELSEVEAQLVRDLTAAGGGGEVLVAGRVYNALTGAGLRRDPAVRPRFRITTTY